MTWNPAERHWMRAPSVPRAPAAVDQLVSPCANKDGVHPVGVQDSTCKYKLGRRKIPMDELGYDLEGLNLVFIYPLSTSLDQVHLM